ncbi:MAG: hypothetical protein E6J58_02075 [Deltaproteobacteria bacterium]|nr:MAG: hypothetical protein E6J58_02075 [Deltaproteobacteria bacterium]
MRGLYAGARRIAVIVAGTVLLLVGIALLVLPGPGIPLVLAGLALLATQFSWARRTLDWTRARAQTAASTVRTKARRNPSPVAAPPCAPLSPELKPPPH